MQVLNYLNIHIFRYSFHIINSRLVHIKLKGYND